MSEQNKTEFTYYQSHGDEEGNFFTVCFGDPDEDIDYIIVGAEETEEGAQEAVKRLNEILSQQTASLQKQLKELQEEFTMRVNYYENKIERMVNSNSEHTEYLQKQVEELREENERLKAALKKVNTAIYHSNLKNTILHDEIRKALNPQDNQK